MGPRKEWILLFSFAVLAFSVSAIDPDTEKTKAKAFSIFSVVTFKNDGCRSTSAATTGQSPFRNGTCYPASQCSSLGGTASGNCASGFGVCCIFLVSSSGSTINQNCTYIRNPGFPTALSTTTAIMYTVNKCTTDVCWLRLDFESMTLAGPVASLEVNGGACQDAFTITSSNNQAIPTICGINTGQHIYVEMGPGATDNAVLNFAFAAAVTGVSRNYEIKVSQIQCSNPNRPPTGCLQYWSTPVGRITTFNFATTISSHLASQDVTACIRRSAGYCCVQYQVCQGVTNAFNIDAVPAVITFGLIDTNCAADWVAIPGSSTQCSFNSMSVSSKYCGYYLGFGLAAINQPICDCTAPFIVSFHTDATVDAKSAIVGATDGNRGVCLDYMQIPCQTN